MKQPSRLNHVEVSDHAVVQYLRRFKGVDIESIKDEIAAKIKKPQQYARFLSDTSAKVRADDAILVITAYRPKPHRTRAVGSALKRK